MGNVIDSKIIKLGGRDIEVMLTESYFGDKRNGKKIIKPYAKFHGKKNYGFYKNSIHLRDEIFGKPRTFCRVTPIDNEDNLTEDINLVTCKKCIERIKKFKEESIE